MTYNSIIYALPKPLLSAIIFLGRTSSNPLLREKVLRLGARWD